jgi:hypothetical protein
MPTKPETKLIKSEIRALKSTLKSEAKARLKERNRLKKIIANCTREISENEKQEGSFEIATNRRIAILLGRLQS